MSNKEIMIGMIIGIVIYVVLYFIHAFARGLETKLVDSTEPMFDAYAANGLAIGVTVITVLVLGLKQPDLLIRLTNSEMWSFLYISLNFELPSMGWLFWILVVMASAVAASSLWLICTFHGYYTISSHVVKIVCVFFCGVLELPWNMAVLSFAWEIAKSVVSLLFFILVFFVFSELSDRAVIKTWHFFSPKHGYLGTGYSVEYRDPNEK